MTFRMWVPLAAVLLLGTAACSSTKQALAPEPRPLGATYPAATTADRTPVADFGDSQTAAPPITLENALALALRFNPDLRASSWEIRAREARTRQASLWPNPEITTSVDEFAGSGSRSKLQGAETGISLSQLIPLGGDVKSRRRVALREQELASWDFETARLDVFTETVRAFTAVVIAQERVRLADSLAAIARRFEQTVAERADAGKVSPLEATRAGVGRANREIAHAGALRDLMIARQALGTLWGDPDPNFESAAGDLSLVAPMPAYRDLAGLIDNNPDVARWLTEDALRQDQLALAKAGRVPDPSISAGPTRFRDSGETALSISVSVPLPIFDRNQGSVQEARYRLSQLGEQARAARLAALRSLHAGLESASAAFEQVRALEDQILPAVEANLRGAQEGYREGKFDLLTVLDAQSELFDASHAYLEAVQTYHHSRAGVERLIGAHLSDLDKVIR